MAVNPCLRSPKGMSLPNAESSLPCRFAEAVIDRRTTTQLDANVLNRPLAIMAFVVALAEASCALHDGKAAAADAVALEVQSPLLHVGDRWRYVIATERPNQLSARRQLTDTVVRIDPGSVTLQRDTLTLPASPSEPATGESKASEVTMGVDWSRRRDILGKTTLVGHDYDFPMVTGKTWHNEFIDTKPGDPATLLLRRYRYRALGWNDVTVPAGRFRALQIETEGDWHVASTAASASPSTARSANEATFHFSTWYVPALKREALILEEVRTPDGGLISRTRIELVSKDVSPGN